MCLKNFTAILFFNCFTTVAFTQTSQEAAFKLLKTDILKLKNNTIPFSFNSWADLKTSINNIKQDSLSTKEIDYLYPVFQAGVNSQNSMVRQIAAEIWCRCIGENSILTNNAVTKLQQFKQTDFTDSAKFYLKMGLNNATNNIGSIAKLTAFVCGNTCIEDLQNVVLKQNISKFDKKDIKLALLRAGEIHNEQRLIQSAKEQVVNDNFVYNLVDDLTYTHNKLIFDYLLEIIMREDKNCTSANNDNPEPMNCAYRLIEKIAPFINDFPAKVNAYNELETKNYIALLKSVREWITKNKNTYTLNQNNY
ncbi:MAG: hypothetical protein ABI315_09860 [Bacteroidia bacterium]